MEGVREHPLLLPRDSSFANKLKRNTDNASIWKVPKFYTIYIT
jgi:hypothetical protein